MALKNNCCHLGRGRISIRPFHCPTQEEPVSPYSWSYVGNTESFSVTPTTNEIEKPDYTSCVGGTECSYTELTALDIALTTCCYSRDNLVRAFSGTGVAIPVETIVGEPHFATVIPGQDTILIPGKCMDPAIPVVVTNVTTATPLVLDVDYVIGEGGEILILDGSANVTDGDELTLDYTTLEAFCIEGFLEATTEVEIRFQGYNCENGQKFNAHLYRAKLFSSGTFEFINGDDFGTIEFTGKLLKDPSKTGAGLSQYLKVTQAA